MKAAQEVDLGKEAVKKLFFMLAIPAILSHLVNALYNMVDRMYIGHIADVGATALTGVGVCFPIIMIISAFEHQEHLFLWGEGMIKALKRFWAIALHLYCYVPSF